MQYKTQTQHSPQSLDLHGWLLEEGMLHSGKHLPSSTFQRCVAFIRFKIMKIKLLFFFFFTFLYPNFVLNWICMFNVIHIWDLWYDLTLWSACSVAVTPSSSSSSSFVLRLPQRTADTKQSLWKVLLPSTASQDQWPDEWQRSTGHTAAQTGSKPLHHQKLEELCKSLGDELRWTNPTGTPDPGLLIPKPHPGVPPALQPEDSHWAHRTLPHLPAHWCAATPAELDRKGLAIALAAYSLTMSVFI